MAKITGADAEIKINTVSLEEDSNTWTLDIAVDTYEDTGFGDAWKDFEEGKPGWTLSVDFFWNGASAKNDATLFALIGGGATAIELYPEGNASGKIKYSGNAILTGMSPAVPVGGMVTMSATFQGKGTLSRATV